MLARADALANLTIELNIRTVAAQAERLEESLRALVARTSRDADFRHAHERRLEQVWAEIVAVKKCVDTNHDDYNNNHNGTANYDACRRYMADAVRQLRRDMADLRRLCSAESKTAADPTQRIRDALASTRRWNRDHKNTQLPDPIFVANYLKQQSKRDPPLAVFLQRALQRRLLRSRPALAREKPSSLEQFCRHLSWGDVLSTVEECLVRDERGAMSALK